MIFISSETMRQKQHKQ